MACVTSASFDASSTNDLNIMKTDRFIQGTRIDSGSAFIGQQCKTVSVYLKKTGSPTGTMYMKIYSNGECGEELDPVTETSSTTVNVATLTTSYVKHDYTFSGDVTLAANDTIVCYFNGTGDDDNGIYLAFGLSNPDSIQQLQYPEGPAVGS